MTQGQRLKKAREILGINQRDMARVLGYTQSAGLSQIEGGRNKASQRTLQMLKSKFNINPDYILTGDGSMFGEPTTEGERYRIIKVLEDTKSNIEKTIKTLQA